MELVILSTDEASRMMRISPNKLRELAEGGEIPAFRVGKNWRYRKQDLISWVESRVQENSASAGGQNA